ncbi:DUF2255 family protein [Cellulomonas soli]|uniref:DUF2255 family protein n=1 Tax=Cellulomonas soli TaxID=931535 RepID=UPI003F85D74F
MANWTSAELTRVGDATELRIASRRPDGALRPDTTIWHVRAGDEIYVRSAHGPQNGWFRRALASGTGRIRSGGIERDVTFEVADPAVRGAVDAAYHQKYDRYGPAPVGAVTGCDVLETTLVVRPQD